MRCSGYGLLALLAWGCGLAQAPAATDSAPQAGYTLHASTRIVLTDVTVSGRDGNPVHGLKAGDFQVLDNGKPQRLVSFEEHAGAAVEAPAQAPRPGVYSNEYMKHLPPVVNALVLDISNMALTDQMYLGYELSRFVQRFPADQPLAVFLRTGADCVMLQDFTWDRELLKAAIRKALPRFRSPDAQYGSDIKALHEVAVTLAPIAGRKNVLWFSGGSAIELHPEAAAFVNMRPIYDELEADRIAVYPVDARGLTVQQIPGQVEQQFAMNDVAAATGGKAFYNNNGLEEIAGRIVDTDRSFYTLTYTPRDFQYDSKWHTVKIKVEGGRYTLRYRQGYFADALRNGEQGSKGETRTRLLADGSRLRVAAETSEPIVFEARVEAAPAGGEAEMKAAQAQPPKRGKQRVSVVYTVPASGFLLRGVDGVEKVQIGAAVLVLNQNGRELDSLAKQFFMTLHTDDPARAMQAKIEVKEEIDADKGDQIFYLQVWDPLTGRRGSLQIPLKVPVEPPH